jgi:hypothetical protein
MLFISFAVPKRNEPKKRAPEMTNSTRTYARYTLPLRSNVRAELRAISGLPAHRHLV